MRIWLLAAAAVFATVAPLRADTLKPRQISADAQWVAHLDLEALWASRAAEQYLKPLLGSERAQKELRKIRAAIGLDLSKDLRALTLWGVQFKPRRGVVLAHADIEEARIAAFLAGLPDYKMTEYRGHKLYSWTDRLHGPNGALIACVYPRPESSRRDSPGATADVTLADDRDSLLLVIAHKPSYIKKALDVLDGEAPNLAEADSLLASEVRNVAGAKGAVVTIGASGLAEAELPLKSPVIRQCEVLSLALGEHGDEVFLDGRLVAKSESSAADVERVLQGLLALGRLAGDSNEDLRKSLETVKISVDKKTVRLKWHGQVDDVLQAAREEWLKKQMQEQ